MTGAFRQAINLAAGKCDRSPHLPGDFLGNLVLLRFKVGDRVFADSGPFRETGLLPVLLR